MMNKVEKYIRYINNNDIDKVKKYINIIDIHYADDYILSRAAKHGNIEIFKFIYNSSTDFNIDRAFLYAVYGKWKHGIKNTNCGNIDICNFLLKRGANIHYICDLSFKHACDHNDTNMILFLVCNGVNINLIEKIELRNKVLNKLRINKIKKWIL